MTQKDINRLRVVNQTIDKVLTIREAAEHLHLSERQVIRLKGGVQQQGPAFIIHNNRGRKPAHAITDKEKEILVQLKESDKYREANFAHFQELLEEHEHVQLSYSTVYRALSEKGIVSPKKHRKKKTHHRRKRKYRRGIIVQIDASPHPWFIGGKPFTIHGAIDDATGEILALFFTKNECLEGYFQVIEQIIRLHGIPLNIYCDKHTIFVSPLDGKLSIEDQLEGKQVNLTQFGRAMEELGINIIKARSAQAKGRIERLWDTLQSRLPVEFKVHGITTMEAANEMLSKFIMRYNEKFAVEPEEPETAFLELSPETDLDNILCLKYERTIIDESAFSFENRYYQLNKNKKKVSALPKAKLTVLTSSKIGVKAAYNGVVYETRVLDERPKKKTVSQSQSKNKNKSPNKPADNHPWKKRTKEKPRLSYGEPDSEILEMLDELFSSTRAWA